MHVCCAYVFVLCFEGAAGRRHVSYIEMQASLALGKHLLSSAPDQAPGQGRREQRQKGLIFALALLTAWQWGQSLSLGGRGWPGGALGLQGRGRVEAGGGEQASFGGGMKLQGEWRGGGGSFPCGGRGSRAWHAL